MLTTKDNTLISEQVKWLGFIGEYVYINNKLVLLDSGSVTIKEDTLSVYEVLKVISGVPLFYQSHIDRLLKSMKLVGIDNEWITYDSFLQKVVELCKANSTYFGNIEIRIDKHKDNIVSCLGFVKYAYPEPFMYMKGVNVGVISAEREIPNAKIKGTDARQKANDFLRKNNDFYEVLLVDKNNNITEGSKSNFFYIKDNIVYTAPVNLILPGITRKYIIKALENMNIKLKEQALCLENIRDIDSAFICGTSPGILPINMVNDNKLDVDNNILRKLMFEFNSIVKDYIVEIQCNIDFYTD